MADLFWPGAERAGAHFDASSFLTAMVRAEGAWLGVLGRPQDLSGILTPDDLDALALGAESGGNPVLDVAKLVRERSGESIAHRGLTSQDVLDTALMLLAKESMTALRQDLAAAVDALISLVVTHRETPMAARTLTQHAVPTTFGLRAATWLTGVLDAAEDVVALRFPVQLGGAAGTMAASVELGLDPVLSRSKFAGLLGLEASVPWHTTRRPVTRIGDACVATTDALARIANDVLALGRPEVRELSEGTGGGSSTMPHKQNPVLSTLIRRAALAAPQLGASLHAASADQVDERAVGGWHVEWSTLSVLVRQTLVASSQAVDLLTGLRVNAERMAATAEASHEDLRAEQRTMARIAGHEPTGDYTGAARAICDEVVARAELLLPQLD